MALEVGSDAPDFTLAGSLGQEDTEVSLKDFEGKNLVVVFYPPGFLPGVLSSNSRFQREGSRNSRKKR